MRESGILMHITSLPGPYGIGSLGKHAYDFIDFLEQSGQHCWQILPLTPTGYGNSPYQSSSSFAGNPYLIDLDLLIAQGLLEQSEVNELIWEQEESRVNFGLMYENRNRILRKAHLRFRETADFSAFCQENQVWLEDYSLYCALKERYCGWPWYVWEDALKFRDPHALAVAKQELSDEIHFTCFVQYLFATQWSDLRNYARAKQVRILGDIPIYVPYDSADVWSNPHLFQLDETLTPTAVAGCPPDAFSEDGQLWGNPLYRWDNMKQDGYAWWLRRLGACAGRYDMVRLDHFRGFEAYWSVPYADTTARNGCWQPGPGQDFFDTLSRELPDLHLIAEDLGFLTEAVLNLRTTSGLPGMKVLQFAFDSPEPSEYLPHNCIPHSVCYTGTHDNMTTRQWLETANADTFRYASTYMRLREEEGLVWGVISSAFATASDLCIIPMQDFLNLGAEARMNFPGTQSDSNWTWRAKKEDFSWELSEKIKKLTGVYDRLGSYAADHTKSERRPFL